MSTTPCIDATAIESLRAIGGDALVIQLIDLFTSYVTEKLRDARRAFESPDIPAFRDAVHPIKSSAGNIGAREIHALCLQLEQLADQQNFTALGPLLDQADKIFACSVAELQRIRSTMSS